MKHRSFLAAALAATLALGAPFAAFADEPTAPPTAPVEVIETETPAETPIVTVEEETAPADEVETPVEAPVEETPEAEDDTETSEAEGSAIPAEAPAPAPAARGGAQTFDANDPSTWTGPQGTQPAGTLSDWVWYAPVRQAAYGPHGTRFNANDAADFRTNAPAGWFFDVSNTIQAPTGEGWQETQVEEGGNILRRITGGTFSAGDALYDPMLLRQADHPFYDPASMWWGIYPESPQTFDARYDLPANSPLRPFRTYAGGYWNPATVNDPLTFGSLRVDHDFVGIELPGVITVNLQTALAELGYNAVEVAVLRADPATGYYANGAVTVQQLGSARIRITGASGYDASFPIAAAVLLADGSQVSVSVNVHATRIKALPTVQDLNYGTSVGETLRISDADLAGAITAPEGTSPSVVVGDLPAGITVGAGSFDYSPTAAEVTGFDFRASLMTSAGMPVFSDPARVTITALGGEVIDPEPEDEEPATAPTLDDFAFAGPLPKGDPMTGTGGSLVPVGTMTGGIDWASTPFNAWFVEVEGLPADYPLNAWLPDGIELFPEEDGAALSFRIRLVNTADPSITSNWASITAPAAAVEPPVVDPEPETPTAGDPRQVPALNPTKNAGGDDFGLLFGGLVVLLGMGLVTVPAVASRRRREQVK